MSFDGDGVGRYSPEVESAVYYCCLEAIQNATKHGGPDLHISVTLRQDGDQLRFDVEDDGAGFEAELVTRDRPPEHARPPRRRRRPPHRAHRSRPGHARVRARAAVHSQ